MNQTQRRWIAFYLVTSIPISGASTDIFVPSLPAITAYFQVDKTFVQLAVCLYLLGYAFFSLIICPLSDSIGRKKPLMISLVIYIVSSFCITLAPTIALFLLGRFIQGAAIAGIIGISRAITPEVFQGEKYLHVTNKNTIAWAIGPIASPFIGGLLQHYLNWHWSFYLLTAYGILVFLSAWIFLPETLKQPTPFSFKQISVRTKIILSTPAFISGCCLCALIFGFIATFNVMGPFLIQSVLGFSAMFYGLMALLMGVAFLTGNVINKQRIRVPAGPRMQASLLVALLVVVIEMAFSLVIHVSLYNIVIPTFILLLCAGMVFPNAYARAMSLFPQFTGTASAVFSASYIFISSVISGVASVLQAHNQWEFSFLTLVLFLLMAVMYFTLYKPNAGTGT